MNKLKLFIALAIFGYLSLIALNCSAQTYQLDNAGKLVKLETTVKPRAKGDSTLFAERDGIKFWTGPKGGVYYWTKSEKSGKWYKRYVSKQK